MNEFKEKLSEYIAYTEKNLAVYNVHTPETEQQKNLIDAMNYSLEAGGNVSVRFWFMHSVKLWVQITERLKLRRVLSK